MAGMERGVRSASGLTGGDAWKMSQRIGRNLMGDAFVTALTRAIAVSETGFMTPASPAFLEVQGTEGTVTVQSLDNTVWLKEKGSDAFVKVEELPAPGKSAMDQFLDAVEHDVPVTFGLEDALQLSAFMDAAYRAHEAKKTVEF